MSDTPHTNQTSHLSFLGKVAEFTNALYYSLYTEKFHSSNLVISSCITVTFTNLSKLQITQKLKKKQNTYMKKNLASEDINKLDSIISLYFKKIYIERG